MFAYLYGDKASNGRYEDDTPRSTKTRHLAPGRLSDIQYTLEVYIDNL